MMGMFRWLYVTFVAVLVALWFLFVGAQGAERPSIRCVDKTCLSFQVQFAPGAFYATTYFQRQVVEDRQPPDELYWPGGKYTPRRVFLLRPTDTSYFDDWSYIERHDSDWLVWVEVERDGVTDKSNVLTVHY